VTSVSRRDILRAALAISPALSPAGRLLAWQDSEAPPKYSTDVNVVNVLATVRDREGRIVSNLTKDDFIIEEDGRPQVIKYFAQQTDQPLIMGLMVDTSGSERRNIESERRASYKFFDQVLREDKDKAFLIHFDWQVELLQDLTSSRKKLDSGLDGLSASPPPSGQNQGGGGRGRGGGGTLLYDAVYLAGDEVMRKEQGRKAVVLFSDGDDNGSRTSLASSIEAAQRSDTLVYSVRFSDASAFGPGFGGGGRRRGGGFPGRGQGGARENGKQVLQRISQETGGEYFETGGGSTLDKIYARIQDELRNQYSLGYTSDQNGAGYRMIRVTAKGKNLTVQARQGYYAK
jgi:VWFA-related protein